MKIANPKAAKLATLADSALEAGLRPRLPTHALGVGHLDSAARIAGGDAA
jgi:hypothetical protein